MIPVPPTAAPTRRRFFSAPTAVCFAALALLFALTGCTTASQSPDVVEQNQTDRWQPSANRLVGHVYSVDLSLHYVVIDRSPYDDALPPAGALLTTRTEELRPTGQLRVSPYQRRHTLGAEIVAGQPNVGDEVVWPRLPPPKKP